MDETVTHADIQRDLAEGNRRFDTIEKRLHEISEMLKHLPQMQQDIAATKDIVEAWTVAKGVGNFLKWASGIAMGLLAIWALAKALAKEMV